MNHRRRSIFFIDSKVQGALMMRTAIYWMFCLFSISVMLICWNVYTGPARGFLDLINELSHRYGPVLIASLILLPIAMMDVMRLSNRFVGPVMRLRAALEDLAANKPVKPLNFRDDDFWRELASSVNEIAARLESEGTSPRQAAEKMNDAAAMVSNSTAN
jgi:hypothetical protein